MYIRLQSLRIWFPKLILENTCILHFKRFDEKIPILTSSSIYYMLENNFSWKRFLMFLALCDLIWRIFLSEIIWSITPFQIDWMNTRKMLHFDAKMGVLWRFLNTSIGIHGYPCIQDTFKNWYPYPWFWYQYPYWIGNYSHIIIHKYHYLFRQVKS